MKRTTIDYGIDLGTTNSAIARIENGNIKIIKSLDDNKDITASAVAFNKKGSTFVGSTAYEMFRRESSTGVRKNASTNAFIEFKRTMGTDKSYFSAYKNASFSSEDFSATLLNYLKGYVNDDQINAAVITVPAAYTVNQIDAVRRAAKIAGFSYIQTLQEPIAAAMAFGVENKQKNGFWVVFDFGGGTFDAALIKVEDGIVQPIDSAGDNHLGGKDLDFALIDNLLIPHIQSLYPINEILNDADKKESFRQSLKFYAETIKNQLSFYDDYELYVAEGDFCQDDLGDEIEIEINVNRTKLATIIVPVFQRAIDITQELLARNNIAANGLESLLLVGGPTLSPVLRAMLESQICMPDTSVDPMTVVSRGAAIYASTLALPDTLIDEQRDLSKVQLNLKYESSSVENTEFVAVKLLNQEARALYVQFSNSDGSWTSNKTQIDSKGEVVELLLSEDKNNNFTLLVFDEKGNCLESEPSNINIIQGAKLGGMPLPFHFGIAYYNFSAKESLFTSLQGLEKNTTLPAVGRLKKELKTQQDIRPGIAEDFLKIPLYQGDDKAENTRALNNEHVYDVIISGAELPKLLPQGSEVELIVSVDKSQQVSIEAFFPYLNFSYELDVPTDRVQSISQAWLDEAFLQAFDEIEDTHLIARLNAAKETYLNNPSDMDSKIKARNELRNVLREFDNQNHESYFDKLAQELQEQFARLESANQRYGNAQTSKQLERLKDELDEVLRVQNASLAKTLLDDIRALHFELTRYYQIIGFIKDCYRNFDSYQWTNYAVAKRVVDEAMQLVENNASEETLSEIVQHIFSYMPEQIKGAKTYTSLLSG